MIGSWVARWKVDSDAAPLTKWHLIESEIEDRRITRCGRQLGKRDGTELAWTEKPTADRCLVCDR